MWIDNNGNIINRAINITVDGVDYSKSIFFDDEFLGQLGISKLTEGDIPDRRYYSYSETVNIETKNVDRVPIEKDIDIVKSRMLGSLSKSFRELSTRPQVDTGLGYFIDCGLDDIRRLEIGRELGVPVIVDIDGNPHAATEEYYNVVIQKMKERGLELYQEKWAKEATIKGFTVISECIEFERTPYSVVEQVMGENMEPIVDENGEPVYSTVTKYKNLVTEWS